MGPCAHAPETGRALAAVIGAFMQGGWCDGRRKFAAGLPDERWSLLMARSGVDRLS